MRSHIVLSMFKVLLGYQIFKYLPSFQVAAAEANVPEPPPNGSPIHGPSKQVLFLMMFFSLTISRIFSDTCSFSSNL